MKEKIKTFTSITFKERVTIENRYCIDLRSKKSVAKELTRPLSTISREISGKPRKGRGKYNADISQAKALEKRKNQGRNTKTENEELKIYVVEKMKLGWSPEQIDIRLSIDFPDDKSMRISYEAIYQYVYNQVRRGGNGKVKEGCEDLKIYLPRRNKRRAKKGFRKAQKAERKDLFPSIDDQS